MRNAASVVAVITQWRTEVGFKRIRGSLFSVQEVTLRDMAILMQKELLAVRLKKLRSGTAN
jgi:hypothetical protein